MLFAVEMLIGNELKMAPFEMYPVLALLVLLYVVYYHYVLYPSCALNFHYLPIGQGSMRIQRGAA